jgi:hypothetical protein
MDMSPAARGGAMMVLSVMAIETIVIGCVSLHRNTAAATAAAAAAAIAHIAAAAEVVVGQHSMTAAVGGGAKQHCDGLCLQ